MLPERDTACQAQALRAALDRFPRAELGIWPTPLHRLPRLGASAGHGSLWIKRDDLACLGLGGNKLRNLEYLLGAALQAGADTVLASGGLQSNLCRLTAAACARLGLRCILVHNDDRPAELEGNMLLNRLAGAEAVFIGRVDETARAAEVATLASRVSAQGHVPFVVGNGGSTPLGALGFVQAALELWEQSAAVQAGIGHVAMVGGMGGTAAGFVLGTALLGGPFRVRVISVEYPPGLLGKLIQTIASGALALLRGPGRLPPPWPGPEEIGRAMTVHGAYVGPGYAVPTPGSLAALRQIACLEGVFLETVYTSKALAGCLDLISRREIPQGEGCCFWHTGGTPALFAQAGQLNAPDGCQIGAALVPGRRPGCGFGQEDRP